MAEDKVLVTLDSFEQRLMASALTDFRNDLLREENEEKPTEDVDGLLLKVIDAAPRKKANRAAR